MYAIVNISGKQVKVEKDQSIYTYRLSGKEGDTVEFDEVLLVSDNGKTDVGTPSVKGAKVTGKIVEHLRDDKVLVFKKKRRKGYQKLNGHRQDLSRVQIDNISK